MAPQPSKITGIGVLTPEPSFTSCCSDAAFHSSVTQVLGFFTSVVLMEKALSEDVLLELVCSRCQTLCCFFASHVGVTWSRTSGSSSSCWPKLSDGDELFLLEV